MKYINGHNQEASIDTDKDCMFAVPCYDCKGKVHFLKYCGEPRTGITGLIPYCEEHYQKIWGKK